MTHKILSRDSLAEAVAGFRRQGQTIVSTNGSFDLLHAGHVAMLEEAKSLGDVLIVGLNSDLSVMRYKGRSRPICPQEQRAAMLAALACTDLVVLFDELTPLPLLEMIRPDIHVNSPEHGYECVEREVVERHGGRIHLARLVEGVSTTHLLARITTAMQQAARRGVFLALSAVQDDEPEHVASICRILIDAAYAVFLVAPDDSSALESLLTTFQAQELPVQRLTRPLDDMEQIDRLVADADIALARSILVTRSMADVQVGREVNCKTILLTGAGNVSARSENLAGAPFEYAVGPNFSSHSLQETLDILSASAARESPLPSRSNGRSGA